MRDGSTAECVVGYDAPDIEMETKSGKAMLLLKAIPWTRIIVDTLLVAGMLLASSSFLTVRSRRCCQRIGKVLPAGCRCGVSGHSVPRQGDRLPCYPSVPRGADAPLSSCHVYISSIGIYRFAGDLSLDQAERAQPGAYAATGAAFGAIYGVVQGVPGVGAYPAFLGLGSLGSLGLAAVWSGPSQRQTSLDTCLTASMFPLFLILSGFSWQLQVSRIQ
jgi:hypothetical protein